MSSDEESFDKSEINQKRDKRLDNPQTFKKGKSGNPAGKPKGTLGFVTLFRKAIKKLAEADGVDVDSAEVDIVLKGLEKAKAGDFKFWDSLFNRVYGKAQSKVDITSGGDRLDSLLKDIAKRDSGIVKGDGSSDS